MQLDSFLLRKCVPVVVRDEDSAGHRFAQPVGFLLRIVADEIVLFQLALNPSAVTDSAGMVHVRSNSIDSRIEPIGILNGGGAAPLSGIPCPPYRPGCFDMRHPLP